jgi:hypothetical protein
MITNAEKYLKNENYKKTLWYDFKNWCHDTKINCPYGIAFEEFMNQPVKPTLTEDEKAILRNIDKEYKGIGRMKDSGILYLEYKHTRDMVFDNYFHHLFQFIKSGEEYEIEELLK